MTYCKKPALGPAPSRRSGQLTHTWWAVLDKTRHIWLFLTSEYYQTQAVMFQANLQLTRARDCKSSWDAGLVLTESCHICAGGQNPWYQLEKQYHSSSRKWAVFAWLSLNSPKHSGYLSIVFKKGQVSFQCLQQAAMKLVYKPLPAQGLSSVRDIHTPSLLFPQSGCFFPIYNIRTMLNLIPLTVFGRQFLPGKVTLLSQTGEIPPTPCNFWAAHLVSQTSSS